MQISEKYLAANDTEVLDHLNGIRFGTLVSHGVDGFDATPIPWVAEMTSGGTVLWGHLATANPQLECLRDNPDVVVTFTGANAYVTPRGLPTPKSAPTWNYIAVHLHGRSEVLDVAETEFAVERLVTAMENDREQPWRTSEMEARRDKLLQFVTGVRIHARCINTKFKLGQNERLDDLERILDNLESEGRQDMVVHMRRVNAGRLVKQ